MLFSLSGRTTATAATTDHAIAQLWNEGSRRCLLHELGIYRAGTTGELPNLVRTTARGTPAAALKASYDACAWDVLTRQAIPVQDDFDRANSASLGSNWTADAFGELTINDPDVSSNECAHSGAAVHETAWWNASTLLRNCAVVQKLVNKSGIVEPGLVVAGPGDATNLRAYVLDIDTSNNWKLFRMDNQSTRPQIGSTVNRAWSAGDYMRLELLGDYVRALHSTDAGVTWTIVLEVLDATYRDDSINPALLLTNSQRIDDFAFANLDVSTLALDLGAFTSQPTLASPRLLGARTGTGTGSEGVGLVWPFGRPIEIPAGTGVALIQANNVVWPASDFYAVWEED